MIVATPVRVPINKIRLTPGSAITIADVTWQEFEAILQELGEKRRTRIAYSQKTLEILSALPAQERLNKIIGYIVATLLDAQEQDWEDFGSTTFRQPEIAGLEPDTCFYIQNAQQVRECTQRIDLSIYPPPDLAIETDVTSRTTLNAYTALRVPEVWVYSNGNLTLNVLSDRQYIESAISPTFPDLGVIKLIPRLVQRALKEGASKVLGELRRQISQEGQQSEKITQTQLNSKL